MEKVIFKSDHIELLDRLVERFLPVPVTEDNVHTGTITALRREGENLIATIAPVCKCCRELVYGLVYSKGTGDCCRNQMQYSDGRWGRKPANQIPFEERTHAEVVAMDGG